MYNPSDTDNRLRPDLKCILFSKLLYKREDFIQYCLIHDTSTPYILVLRGTCEATVRAISIIVHLSNALQIFFTVVRASNYNNTPCILRIVSMVLCHIPSKGVCSKLSMYYGMGLIDS